jgi:hypothetical protein
VEKPKFPLIVSPNLGCPEIVSLRTFDASGFRVIIAAPASEELNTETYSLSASPSFEGEGREFELKLAAVGRKARKLADEALSPCFNDVNETRLLISTTLRRQLFPGYDFWEVAAKPNIPIGKEYLRAVDHDFRSTLYDLSLSVDGQVVGQVRHALCLRVGEPTVKFVHLTDLHVAARNDIWEAEVRAVLEGSPSAPGEQEFRNFNGQLRNFIKWANKAADEGHLDFVWALGDLVDFCRTGLYYQTPDDSNWSALIDILVGSPLEQQRGNKGLRVPIFTSTGNHDWRTYPYSPVARWDIFGITKRWRIFGITKKCAKELDSWYRNSSEEIGQKLHEVEVDLIRKGSPLLARSWWGAITTMGLRGVVVGLKRLYQREVAAIEKYGRQMLWALVGLLGIGAAFAFRAHSVMGIVGLALLLLFALASTIVTPSLLLAWLRRLLEDMIAIEADVSTLSEYFLRVNPYLNYAFQLENCYFVVLDTGPDCLTAQRFWDNGGKKVRRISIKDNILGGSPDTMGFYPANEYYPYSQIAWLENVLSCIRPQESADPQKCRIFVGLHAPPANLSESKRKQAEERLELNEQRNKPFVLMTQGPLDGYDVRYGTVNHYLSQFFYLCLGYLERKRDEVTHPGIDAVFAGHAHWNMEFELRKPDGEDAEWSPELLYGNFSNAVDAGRHDLSGHRTALLLQTAACGPMGAISTEVPPNFRYVTVNANGEVRHLRPYTLADPPLLGAAKAAASGAT